MTTAYGDRLMFLDSDVDLLAWQFLDSHYVGTAYGNWPIDRRVEGFLRHHGMARVADDGDTVSVLVRRVMSYMRIFNPGSDLSGGTPAVGGARDDERADT